MYEWNIKTEAIFFRWLWGQSEKGGGGKLIRDYPMSDLPELIDEVSVVEFCMLVEDWLQGSDRWVDGFDGEKMTVDEAIVFAYIVMPLACLKFDVVCMGVKELDTLAAA